MDLATRNASLPLLPALFPQVIVLMQPAKCLAAPPRALAGAGSGHRDAAEAEVNVSFTAMNEAEVPPLWYLGDAGGWSTCRGIGISSEGGSFPADSEL